jgi:hypothetical protein
MSAVVTRTVPVSSNQLDTAIEVLSSAGRELQLTRFEKFSYRALMVSTDVIIVSFLAVFGLTLVLASVALIAAFSETSADDVKLFYGRGVPRFLSPPPSTMSPLLSG